VSLRVGIDLVCSDHVRDAIREHGDRYLQRIYTAAELTDCHGDHLKLAARFAAKEAMLKVLRDGDEPIPWNTIAVRRDSAGRPSIELTGAAAELARRRGITPVDVSVSHEDRFAVAVVLAELG
jgi:holo-[acyl-carrier protein] synthase